MGSAYIQPGYEDTFYYLWRERRLPVNVDPFDSRLDDEMERVRLRRVFDAGLSAVTGYVLPLAREHDAALAGARWVTSPWFFRDDRMYLIPGDSPMGYRLPLDSLPWVSKSDYPYQHAHDPFGPIAPLRTAAELRMQYQGESAGAAAKAASAAGGTGTALDARMPAHSESASWVHRTALCVEARDPRRANGPKAEGQGQASGVLYVFMPPLEKLEHYLELLTAVEAACEDTGFLVIVLHHADRMQDRCEHRRAVLDAAPAPRHLVDGREGRDGQRGGGGND